MPHNFAEKLAEGQAWEEALDAYFERWYTIQPVGPDGQRAGIDRLWTRPDGSVVRVEYKADSRAAETGNAFLEVVSVDKTAKTGWVYSSQADLLVYLIPPRRVLYLVRMERLRDAMQVWSREFPIRSADNGSYLTHGVCVPLTQFQGASDNVIRW